MLNDASVHKTLRLKEMHEATLVELTCASFLFE